MEIKNSIVVITGGAIRVGREFALHLAHQGANIVFSYLNDSEDWRQTKTDIENIGVKCLAVQTDIRSVSQIKKLMQEAVTEFGNIDTLINNAGIWLKSPALKISEDEWDQSMDINLKGPFFCMQTAAPIMNKQGHGVIINITDLSAFQVWPSYTHHAAGKTGLVSITKYMALELAPDIRVNAVAMGTVMVPPNASAEKIKWSEEKSLLKRIGKPEEAAKLIQFIIENDFVTGSVYLMDGGRSLV